MRRVGRGEERDTITYLIKFLPTLVVLLYLARDESRESWSFDLYKQMARLSMDLRSY